MENNFNLEDFKINLEDYNFEDLEKLMQENENWKLEDFKINLEDYNFEEMEKLIKNLNL